MSVVVCKVNEDNIEVAADSICVSGWSKLPISGNRHIKLAKYNGMIVGGVGLAEEVSLFFHYMKTHTIDEVTEKGVLDFILEFRDWKSTYTRTSTFEADYIIAYKGKAFAISGMLITPIDKWYAIGAGRDYASGALYTGASATEAVKAACDLCAMVAEPIVLKTIPKGK